MAWYTEWTVWAPLVIVFLVFVISTLATFRATGKNGWYNKLCISPYSPPNWFFGVAWLILYIMIILAWMGANYYITDTATFDTLNWLLTVNLALNMAWSVLFFGEGKFGLGLVILVLMIASMFWVLYLVRNNDWIFWLLLIYTVWLVFAFFLNLYVVEHNPPLHMMNL
jgi:tryptophan-rich sensory protein